MRATPASTTYRMPGTVSEVSATLVASTHPAPAGARSKTLCCSADDSRAYSGTTSNASAGRVASLRQHVGGVADLPLAGQEHQDVAGTLADQLLDGVDDRLGLVADDRLALVVARQASSTSGR